MGTPRRWLWPVLALLGRAGIVFPVWERDVPFEVENRPTARGLAGIRTFRFGTGSRVMVDEVRWSGGRLLQGLGSPALLVVRAHRIRRSTAGWSCVRDEPRCGSGGTCSGCPSRRPCTWPSTERVGGST